MFLMTDLLNSVARYCINSASLDFEMEVDDAE